MKIKYLISPIIVILILLALIPAPVEATAGSTVVTTTIYATSNRNIGVTGAYQAWSTMCLANAQTDKGPAGQSYYSNFYCWSATQWAGSKTVLSFDVSTIPVGANIKSVQIISQDRVTYDGGTPANWKGSYATFYMMANHSDTVDGTDWSNALKSPNLNTPLFQYKSALDYSSSFSTQTYTMYAGWLALFLNMQNSNHRIYLTFALQRLQLNAQPDTYAGGHSLVIDSNLGSPYLKVTYVAPPMARDTGIIPRGNGPVPALISGNETASNVTWGTPRCAFNDEKMIFNINGIPGANVTMRLIGQSGELLASHSDIIRETYNDYEWVVPAVTPYSGWVRVVEDKNNLYSPYGYVDKTPSPTIQNLMTYAADTAYPQYDNSFSKYVVYKDGLMFVYWSTNIAVGELSNYNLSMWINGLNTNGSMFDQSLTWLNTNYYLTGYASCNFLAAYRYMIMTPQIQASGFNDGNGLVYNLNQPYAFTTSGFITPEFYNNSDNTVITTCHTAYYYLQNNLIDGLNIGISGGAANQMVEATINVGVSTKIASDLSNLTLQIIDSAGAVSATVNGNVVVGQNLGTILAPTANGDYQLRCTFSDSVKSPYYSLILDIPFTVTGGTAPTTTSTPGPGTPIDPLGWIKSLVAKYHLDNEGGHWLIIFILCVLWVALLRKNRVALAGMITITIGGALVLRWINPWFYVLVIGGVTFIIYRLIKGHESKDEA